MKRRASGVLLHVTSLPSRFGIGDFGPEAYRFGDFLARSQQSFWQILPLNPTEAFHHHTPYHTTGAFACNSLLISPELLAGDGLLESRDIESPPDFPHHRTDFSAVARYKNELFQKAFERFRPRGDAVGYRKFCMESAHWLDSFALFMALKHRYDGEVWNKWPQALRDREQGDLD